MEKIKLSLLKKLFGITQGSSPDVLTTVNKSYIRPVLDYGGELLAIPPISCFDEGGKVQNKSLRLITSAAYFIPITALEIQSGLLRFADKNSYITSLKSVRDFLYSTLAEACV